MAKEGGFWSLLNNSDSTTGKPNDQIDTRVFMNWGASAGLSLLGRECKGLVG